MNLRTQTEENQVESLSKSKASGVMSAAAVKRAEEKKKIQAALSGNKGITDTTSINQKDPISMLKTPAATNMVPSNKSGDSKSSSASSETSASSVASSMKGTASSLRAQAKTKAYADARKARLEEIRGKVGYLISALSFQNNVNPQVFLSFSKPPIFIFLHVRANPLPLPKYLQLIRLLDSQGGILWSLEVIWLPKLRTSQGLYITFSLRQIQTLPRKSENFLQSK
jgi:hypothetical protein